MRVRSCGVDDGAAAGAAVVVADGNGVGGVVEVQVDRAEHAA